jgi:hypothetical protein
VLSPGPSQMKRTVLELSVATSWPLGGNEFVGVTMIMPAFHPSLDATKECVKCAVRFLGNALRNWLSVVSDRGAAAAGREAAAAFRAGAADAFCRQDRR